MVDRDCTKCGHDAIKFDESNGICDTLLNLGMRGDNGMFSTCKCRCRE